MHTLLKLTLLPTRNYMKNTYLMKLCILIACSSLQITAAHVSLKGAVASGQGAKILVSAKGARATTGGRILVSAAGAIVRGNGSSIKATEDGTEVSSEGDPIIFNHPLTGDDIEAQSTKGRAVIFFAERQGHIFGREGEMRTEVTPSNINRNSGWFSWLNPQNASEKRVIFLKAGEQCDGDLNNVKSCVDSY